MNPTQLLTHFDRISEAPDAIPRLRRFILALAVRGKLVEQDPKDEPASELLKRIRAEKERLVKAGEIRKENLLPQIDIQPYEIPKGWEWTILGNTGRIFNGNSVSESEKDDLSKVTEGYPFIATKDVGYGREMLAYENGIRVPFDASGFKVAHAQAVLICSEGGSAGKKVGLTDRDICFGNKLYANEVWPGIHSRYILSLYQTTAFFKQFAARMTGIIGGIARSEFLLLPVPIPPENEQHRIVAKVDELMVLCNRLEAAQTERESRRDRLVVASLQRLNRPADAGDAQAFREHARFYFKHLPRLTTRLEHIQQLRQTILNLAVMGKLTESRQDGLDAHEELQAVENKKRELALRNPKPITPISPEEEWCDLPDKWVWARWDQITDWITYGFTRPMSHEKHGIPIVTGRNVNYGKIIFETAERTTKKAYLALNDKDRPKPGDILVTKDGSIGRSAIVATEEPFCINQSVAVLWLRSCHFNKQFLQLAIDCPQTQRALLAKTEGVAIKHISVVDLGKMVFPLPPLAEQHRIVAKVEELLALCDQLEAQLTTAQTESRLLLEAVLHEALTPALEKIA